MQREFHLYSQENGKNPTYIGVLGDTGRTLKCYMNDVNVLEEVSEARIWVKKPDGTNVYNDCEVNEDGTITISITSQMLAIVGEAVAQVQLYGDDGYITSYEFKIVVLDTIVDEDAPQSTNEWGALETLLAKADAVIVSTKAEMTDHDKIYFLSTDGHYYYWSSVDNDFVKTELSHADIVDNLLSDDATKVLSAKQGKILKELIDTHEVDIATVDTPGIVKPDGTTITITPDGTISGAQTYELPTASASTKGGVKIGDHLHMDGEVLSADGGIYVGDTEPTDVDVWIDTSEEGADFCYVGPDEPPNDGSVAVWVDTLNKVIKTLVGGVWNNVYDVATQSTNGLMSSADKSKLDKMSNYSTNEQIIGTWIDGKPLYRKVITGNINGQGDTILNTNISGLDTVVKAYGVFKTGNDFQLLSGYIWDVAQTSNPYVSVIMNINSSTLKTRLNRWSSSGTFPAFVIVEYTKTTD